MEINRQMSFHNFPICNQHHSTPAQIVSCNGCSRLQIFALCSSPYVFPSQYFIGRSVVSSTYNGIPENTDLFFLLTVWNIFDAPVGTEELAHCEMIGAIVHQLTRNLTPEQIKQSGFDAYFVDHTTGVYPQAASGTPFSAATLQSTGDAIADLFEDQAAEQKARLTYDNLLRLLDDPDVRDPIKFLREREIVHFQRFGEALRDVQENLDAKNYYAYNPSFDTCAAKRK